MSEYQQCCGGHPLTVERAEEWINDRLNCTPPIAKEIIIFLLAKVKEQHETLRMISNQSWSDDKEKLEAADWMRTEARKLARAKKQEPVATPKPPEEGPYPRDMTCFYAKSCGFESGCCPTCEDGAPLPADGIYYSDELGTPEEEQL